jgi:glycosyltransferase involved in cell wall biosynthesis
LQGELFVASAIESVLDQEYPRLEYIVVDGGSTDATAEIARGYGRRVRLVVLPGASQSAALNAGFALASGQIFGFLNADDTYLPGAISAAVDALARHPDAPAVYGEADHVDAAGRILERYPVEPFDPLALRQRCIVCQPAAFIRSAAWRAVGGVDERLEYALDYDLWIRLARIAPLVKFDGKLAQSRMHLGNKTLGSRRAAYAETMRVLRRHYGYIPYDWVIAYASHLWDPRDHFFQESRPTRLNVLASLALGLAYNPRQVGRYFRDWFAHRGFGIARN